MAAARHLSAASVLRYAQPGTALGGGLSGYAA
jgi:hypothetical protein